MSKLNKDKMKRRLQFNRAWIKSIRDARIKREKRALTKAEQNHADR
jgi:hypothetical protein